MRREPLGYVPGILEKAPGTRKEKGRSVGGRRFKIIEFYKTPESIWRKLSIVRGNRSETIPL